VDNKDNSTEIIKEAYRILDAARQRNVIMRLLGAIAFRIHCPKYSYIHNSIKRYISDIDFVAYSQQQKIIEKLLEELDYETDRMIKALTCGKRLIFYNKTDNSLHVDVFFDKLEMCHTINFVGRLELDYPTISLVDMLLEKLQIVKLEGKDIVDVIMLLREHELGNDDNEHIHYKYLANTCAKDWGLYFTVTTNLKKIKDSLKVYNKILSECDINNVESKINKLLESIEQEPKTYAWKLRSKIGVKKKWFREVEEIKR
jgi:hypothetical protein